MRITLLATALIAAVSPALADPIEDAIAARQGYYNILNTSLLSLGAMAKGDVDYDAEAAKVHSGNMVTATTLDLRFMFPPGSSNADKPGMTRALPGIWENFPDVGAKGAAFVEAVQKLDAVAGDGLASLGPAIAEVGATCTACHREYRARN